jgi:predicted kinase
MSGLPRSGKSTIARRVYLPMGYTVVNPDQFRLTMFGQRYYGAGEPLLWATIYHVVDALLASDNKVLLDATNLNIERRAAWVRRGVQFVVVDTPEDECVRRAEAENDDYIIPVIHRMAGTQEPMEEWEPVAKVHKWQSEKT